MCRCRVHEHAFVNVNRDTAPTEQPGWSATQPTCITPTGNRQFVTRQAAGLLKPEACGNERSESREQRAVASSGFETNSRSCDRASLHCPKTEKVQAASQEGMPSVGCASPQIRINEGGTIHTRLKPRRGRNCTIATAVGYARVNLYFLKELLFVLEAIYKPLDGIAEYSDRSKGCKSTEADRPGQQFSARRGTAKQGIRAAVHGHV